MEGIVKMNLLGSEKQKTFYFTVKVDYGASSITDAVESYDKARKDLNCGTRPVLVKVEKQGSSTYFLTYDVTITDKTVENAMSRVRKQFVGSFWITDVRTSYYGSGG